MPKYEAWLTIYASVKTYLETDKKYNLEDESALKELREKFVEDGESQSGGLCHYCSSTIDLGDEPVIDQGEFSITLAEEE